MLTKNLLEVDRDPSTGEIRPGYRHPDEEADVACKVLEAYEPGRTKGDIWEELSGYETHDNFKFLRGLSRLVERHSEFGSDPPSEPEMSPGEVRERLWEGGFVTSEAERNRRVAELARETDLTTREIEESFWADREENETVVSVADTTPRALVERYNLSLTQTLLFDALELEFRLGGEADYQRVFSEVKRLGLMYTVDPELKVSVTGPAALFKRTRKYGNAMARLLPTLLEAEEWTLYAKVRSDAPYDDDRSKRVYDLELSSIPEDGDLPDDESPDTDYLPGFADDASLVEKGYDSEVERSFASRIETFAEGWEVVREPTVLRVDHSSGGGVSVMIPDFGFRRVVGDEVRREFYLEIVGFWTPDYLADKIEKVRDVETEPDVSLVLAVNEDLRATEEEFGDVDEVFFYDREVPVKPVVERLERLEDELRREDLLALEEEGIGDASPDGGIVSVGEIAEREGYDPGAVAEYLSASDDHGVVYKGEYVPRATVEEIRERVASSDLSLSGVRGILDGYGLGEGFLERIGYEVRWESFAEEDAEIIPADG